MSSDVTETTGFYEFLAWFEVNRKRIYAIAGAVAAISLVVAFVIWQKNQKEIRAHEELLRLGLPMTASEGQKGPGASEYLKISENFSGTYAAQMALLKAAEICYTETRYGEALDHYKKFMALYNGSKMVQIALVGVAACQESQNNLEEALKSYQNIVAQYPDEPVASQSKLAIARINVTKKQPAEALKIYDDLLKAKNRSMYLMEATTARDYLLLKNPGLNPQPVAAATSTNTKATLPAGKTPEKPASNSVTATTAKTNNAPVTTNKPAPAKQ